MANPARAYLATQVETTSQGQLLIMLYEAAIKFLKRAKIEIGNKDYAKKGIYISKAMAIIHELTESLNKEKGGDITPSLLSLYQFCTTHLIQANIRLDTKRIDDVIQILDGISSAYAQVVEQQEGPSASSTLSAKTNAVQSAPSAQRATTQTTAPKPGNRYGLSGLSGLSGMGRGAHSTTAAAPTAPAQQKEGPVAEAAAPADVSSSPEPPQEMPSSAQPQAPVQPPTPQLTKPKMRKAFNAAKFRAANAYSNNS
ncbi:flagellar export chaperone FliS [Pseudodesulfovibrio sp.]|uniref:flagellar export chaperone FliS n=1 Tax=unclassified Pseudodesulfovibrio TaxID=2661612 RepID=UPI003B007BA1